MHLFHIVLIRFTNYFYFLLGAGTAGNKCIWVCVFDLAHLISLDLVIVIIKAIICHAFLFGKFLMKI